MKIDCIALDLDQTTLNSKGRLSGRNREALDAVLRAGIQVVAASGRALHSLPSDITEIPGIRYAVTSNGAAVCDLHKKAVLKQYKMTAGSVEQILAITGGTGAAYEAFIDGMAYAQKSYVEDPVSFGAGTRAVPYIQSTRTPVEDIGRFIAENQERLDCMDVVVGDPEEKKRLWESLARNVKDVYITSSVSQLLEISYREAGKHTGVKFLLEYLGLAPDAMAAFGDGDNDVELLRFAGVGIAVENGSPACKAAADYITKTNDEDGVAWGIEHILSL